MKIGTLTYWNTDENYGQIMQCFALLQFLKSQGHEARLVRYVKNPQQETFLQKCWKWLGMLSITRIKSGIQLRKFRKEMARNRQLHPRHFDEFRDKYVPVTEKVYDDTSLFEAPPAYDAFVCGSDQIWGEPNPVFMLQFAPDGCRRIAYAASMGGVELKGEMKERFSNFLSSFDFVSLREQHGVDFCRSLGRDDAVLVPDPTLLLSRDKYTEIYEKAQPSIPAKPYLLLYLLGNPISVDVASVYDYAKQKGLDVVYVASQGRTDAFEKTYPTVEEWLALVDNAQCMFTNSFHGTVFCLMFNTPFLSLPVTGVFSRMNGRLQGLLERYNLKERIYKDNLLEIEEVCDFSFFNEKREADEANVKKMLEQALSSK